MAPSATTIDRRAAMLAEAGEESYGGEAVSKLEHALRAAAATVGHYRPLLERTQTARG